MRERLQDQDLDDAARPLARHRRGKQWGEQAIGFAMMPFLLARPSSREQPRQGDVFEFTQV